MDTITVQSLHKQINEEKLVFLIDVRTPVEYREVHVENAVNIPLHELTAEEVKKHTSNGTPVYLICHKGSRSQMGWKQLKNAGIENVVSVQGGTEAWEQAGFDVIRGVKAISVERQVRIAAGSLVLIGVIFGLLGSTLWFGLSAFVGAGLIFAGITDTCGMGIILARMPWNKV